MMNVASFELCKELYELSGWWDGVDMYYDKYGNNFIQPDSRASFDTPAYGLGYLLRKLYTFGPFIGFNLEARPDTHNDKKRYFAIILQEGIDIRIWSDTPENATCQVAIELFKQGVIRPVEK